MKVIVTGGASGIGKEVGNYLMSNLYEVISVDLEEEHGAIKLDVVNEEAWNELMGLEASDQDPEANRVYKPG